MNPKSENIVYTFEPNHQLKAIQKVIKKRHEQQMKQQLPQKEQDHVQFHQHGLPSPPLDDKKFLSSHEIKTKLESLKQEKHELFQLMKKLMLYEQTKSA